LKNQIVNYYKIKVQAVELIETVLLKEKLVKKIIKIYLYKMHLEWPFKKMKYLMIFIAREFVLLFLIRMIALSK